MPLLGSYWILSRNRYVGKPSVTSVPKIDKEDYHSMEFLPLTVSSWPREAHMPQKPHFIRGEDGNIYAVTRTANNIFFTFPEDYAKYGHFSQIDDYSMDEFKSAGEDDMPNKHDVIPTMPGFAYITGISPSRINLSDIRDTAVNLRTTKRIVEAVDPDKIGFYESKKANLYDNLRSVIDDTRYRFEAEELLDFFDSKGIPIKRENPVRGIGVEKGDFYAGYYPKQWYLVAEVNFHDRVKDLFSRYGLDEKEAIEAMERSILFHEAFGHGTARISGSRKGEGLQGLIAAEFYSMMASKYQGTKMEKIYRTLAKENSDYAESYSRFSLSDLLPDLYPKENEAINAIVSKFEAEGKAVGLEGKHLRAYVNSRIRDTYGALLKDEESYATPSNKSSRAENLESLVESWSAEAKSLGIDKAEYISSKMSSNSYINEKTHDKSSKYNNKNKKTYEESSDNPEYKSMSDVKARAKGEDTDAEAEKSEPAEKNLKDAKSDAPEPSEASAE